MIKHAINLRQKEDNQSLLKKEFPWLDTDNLRVYSTPELAISEAVLGLSSLLAHKKEVLIRSGQSPYTAKLKEFISKKGLKAKELNQNNLEEDHLVNIQAYDNPLTGEVLRIQDGLEKTNKKSIFSIVIHHTHFLCEDFSYSTHPYEIHIFCLSPTQAFSVLGSRAKKIIGTSPRTDSVFWGPVAKVKEDKKQVIQKEETLKKELPNIELFFSKESSRVYDRIIFYLPQKNGDYILNVINQEGAFTTSPCFWSHPFQLAWWRELNDEKQWLILPFDVDIKVIKEKLKSL